MTFHAPKARYHLRFQLTPGADLADRAAGLAKVCREHGIAEVVLLLGAEEAYTGHLAGAEEDLWFEAAAEASEVLTAAGVEVSLNPWVTVGHADRGRRDRLGFAPMVSPTGQVAAAQASFACPTWRAWLYAHYGRFARLGFRVLWVEDDFRFHNHAPLDWGGGFEPLMMERLSLLVGRPVAREEVVEAVTAPGPPHPWRGLLQQVWRSAQLEVAEGLAEAVRENSAGRSQLGLMNSVPAMHSVEGRDWTALFEALSIEGRVVQRPHFAPYADTPARSLASSVWALEAQRPLRPAYVSCEPEIENWPHTSWTKSDTQTWSEMVTAQLAGADALLLNVHPSSAGRAEEFPRIDRLLSRSRPALDWVAALRPEQAVSLGVGLPWRPDTAARLRTVEGQLGELVAGPAATAEFLLGYGVPVTAEAAPVQALFGRAVDAFEDKELRAMLRGGLLLDGVAAHLLTERGFADLLGVRAGALHTREEAAQPGPYAAERITAQAGADEGAWVSVDVQPALARLEPADGADVLTEVVTPEGRHWGAGRCHFVNALGGRVAVLAATAPVELARSDRRQRLLHASVRFLQGDHPPLPLVDGAPHLIPQLSRSGDLLRLAIANGSADPAHVRIALPLSPASVRATLLAPLAAPEPVSVTGTAGRLELETAVPHHGRLVLEWRTASGRSPVRTPSPLS
ncbi:hypothetical protein [Streptomyces indicus]|uniref:Uncharacterized protein n=1 Tax=Streptomyces indicus TaxID=417292 RepID=A0A1G9GJZ3_9ACTN|nr:hypothetical protein [Streptomyces indicus]SDL00991.1 hypothetical protein SAMN05421806_11646 [Streptomyces indicus]